MTTLTVDRLLDDVFGDKPPEDDTSDPVAWIQTHFYIPETNKPIELYPSQVVPLTEALAVDDGLFRYSTVDWSVIKKSAKSCIAAAVGLWMCWRKPWSSVKVIANDLKQADSRVAFYMRRAIELHPKWKQSCKIANYKITLPNHSLIEAIPIDPRGEAGGGDDLLIFSEIWGWKDKAAVKMWTEMTLSPLKYGHSLRWAEGYAGFVGESPILEQLYQTGVKDGRSINDEYEMYANDAARLFTVWQTRPHLPWQTPAYYAQEAATLQPNEYARIHENKWGKSSETFVPDAWWDACQQELPERGRRMMVVGMDAAVSNDCFALVGVTRHSTGIQGDEQIIVRYVRIWKPPEGGKIDFSDVEAEVKRLAKEDRVACFVYDPTQLHDMTQRLTRAGVGWFEPFEQGARRLLADKQLYDMIRDRRIVHSNPADLTEHIKNANRKAENEKLRIVKRKEDLKIDAAVALSMASHQALGLNV
jgi:phage terminase large subunit-like protein